MNLKNRRNTKIDTQPLGEPLTMVAQPAVYNGLENDIYTLFFNDLVFTNEVIESLIIALEDVKVSGSYSVIDIYISSVGGLANQLIMFADYLNNYPLDINFKIHGEVSSCGSLLPLMVKGATIEYLPTARAMFHLGHQRVHSSIRYHYKPNLDMSSSDLEGLEELNTYLWDNFYSKLDLEEEEFEALKKGQDVFVNRERIEHIYETFKERQFFENELPQVLVEIDQQIELKKEEIKNLKETRKTLVDEKEDFCQEFDLDENFNSKNEVDEEEEIKIGLTD